MFKQIIACLLFVCVTTGIMQAQGTARDVRTFEGTLKTGIFAIGGETTGTILTAKDGSRLELDFGKDATLAKLADDLNGKDVIVTGEFITIQGTEIKERHVFAVHTLKEAK